jgi:hypothetical protein
VFQFDVPSFGPDSAGHAYLDLARHLRNDESTVLDRVVQIASTPQQTEDGVDLQPLSDVVADLPMTEPPPSTPTGAASAVTPTRCQPTRQRRRRRRREAEGPPLTASSRLQQASHRA